MEAGDRSGDRRAMRTRVLPIVVSLLVALVACRKSKSDDVPVVKAAPSECDKLLARLGGPGCKAPAVDATTLDVAQTMALASMDGDPNLRSAHEENCKASNAELDKYKECAP